MVTRRQPSRERESPEEFSFLFNDFGRHSRLTGSLEVNRIVKRIPSKFGKADHFTVCGHPLSRT